MKKIFLVLTVMALTTFFATAQNSMEFSRVLLVETLDSVPQGKIWKVESVLLACNAFCTASIFVNGIQIYMAHMGNGAPGYNGLEVSSWIPTKLPIWLPEGTTLQAGTNVQYISVIEFNIQ